MEEKHILIAARAGNTHEAQTQSCPCRGRVQRPPAIEGTRALSRAPALQWEEAETATQRRHPQTGTRRKQMSFRARSGAATGL